MATTEYALRKLPRPQILTRQVERPSRARWLSWVATTDHKRIGILYMVAAFVFFMIGGTEALLMRIQLGAPENTFLTPTAYNQLFTLHGTTMIFLFVVPMMSGFANYFVPLQIGARDMAFPRLNALSFWLFVCGGVVFYASLFWSPPQAGWTSYPPLSSSAYLPDGGIDAWIYLIHLTGLSSILGAINLYVTILNMRAPGMGWSRLPLFCWTILTFAILLILALPSVAAGVTLLLTDRHFGTHFFDPTQGGSALLWQHLFWFFGHPEVYIMILPGFGIISEILPVFARKPIFGYRAIAAATVGIAFLSLLVWAHHMFATPLSSIVLAFFMLSSMIIAIPTGVKIFNWIATLWRGTIIMKTPLYFAVGFLAFFTLGGISGVMLAIFAIFAGLYYWYPKVTGRMMSDSLGKVSFWLTFVGFNATFLVQHSIGLEGMPRRVYEYPDIADLHVLNLISTIGSFILALGVVVTAYNLVRSLKKGVTAGPDPWKGNTLEWFTTSPPPENNFDVIPRVRSVEPMKDIRRQVERGADAAAARRVGGPAPKVRA
jgi:cytochrome c oxidase subunit 1